MSVLHRLALVLDSTENQAPKKIKNKNAEPKHSQIISLQFQKTDNQKDGASRISCLITHDSVIMPLFTLLY